MLCVNCTLAQNEEQLILTHLQQVRSLATRAHRRYPAQLRWC